MSKRGPPGVRSWEYPACPKCTSDVFVESRGQSATRADYECLACEHRFTAAEAGR